MNGTAKRFFAIGVCASVGLLGVACGDDSTDSKDSSTDTTTTVASSAAKDTALAAMVPAKIADSGTLTVGSDTTYAPSEFLDTDNKTPIGFDVDLITAIATTLGLKADVQTSSFDAIIPGITKSAKYDVGVSSFTINPERLKEVDFVSYYSAGTLWATAADGSIDPDNACGKRIAVQKATVQDDDITARSATCTDAGKAAIEIDKFEKQTDVTQAVISGKDDAMLADSPVVAYAVKQNNKLKLAGTLYDAAPYGIAMAKDSGDLGKAIQGALKALIENGEYAKILDKWGVESGALTADQILVNPSA